MAEKAAGIVGYIRPRKVAAGYTTYAFTFDDRDDERWFGTYKTNPEDKGAVVGAYVEFEYTRSSAGFNNVDLKTLEVFEAEEEESESGEDEEQEEDEQEESPKPPPRKKRPTEKAAKAGAGKGKSGGPARAAAAQGAASNKDANIQWQSARNAALHFVEIANQAGALDIGTGKKAAKLEALAIIVNQQTLDFFNASMQVSETGTAPDVPVEA